MPSESENLLEPQTPMSPTTLTIMIERKLHIRRAIKALKDLSPMQIVIILFLVIAVIAGNGGQLISLNMWLNNFGEYQQPRPFAVLTLSALTIATSFGIAAAVRIIVYRPNMGFLFSLRGFVLTVAVGFCNATNGVFLVYATGNTPEVLQALLLSTQIFWTLLASSILLKENRSYLSWPVGVAFLFSAAGIILGASSQFNAKEITYDKKMWTLIFAGSMIPGALYNVFASKYMRAFTHPKDESGAPIVDDGDVNSPTTPTYSSLDRRDRSDDTTVKLTMLCTTGFSQVFWMFVYFPLDSAPWFGSCTSLSESRHALAEGWKCVFDNDYCRNNFVYYLLFNASYFLNYVGSAYLNHYSAGLCSMVTQLSSPLTAILLIAVPAWNVQKLNYNVGSAIGGAIFIFIGSLVYASWEQGSRDRADEIKRSSRNVSGKHLEGDFEDEVDPKMKVWV